MNKKNKIMILFGLICILPAIIYAETYWGGELPNISDTKLKSEVIYDGDIYTYSYTIISGPSNAGQIWSFDIDIKHPQGGVELSGEGLVNGPGYAKHTSAQVLSEPTTPKMIPVGLWSPSTWTSGLSVFGESGWGSKAAQYRISPGQSLSGFQISTRGLPGIKNFKIEPKLIPPSAGDTEESGEPVSLEEYQAVEDKVAFKGKTIGPTAPPADFKPIPFLDYIISLKHEAYNLGWIKNTGIEQSLDAKLDNAKKKIEQGNIEAAKNILAAFINEVEAQNGKHLTSEAYALLKYNVQYLISKLL